MRPRNFSFSFGYTYVVSKIKIFSSSFSLVNLMKFLVLRSFSNSFSFSVIYKILLVLRSLVLVVLVLI